MKTFEEQLVDFLNDRCISPEDSIDQLVFEGLNIEFLGEEKGWQLNNEQ